MNIPFKGIMIQFHCLATDGPAQTGILTINKSKIRTPALFFPSSDRYCPPAYATCFIDSSKSPHKNEPCITIGSSIFFKNDSSNENHQCNVQDHVIIPESLPSSIQRFIYQLDQQKKTQVMVLASDEGIIDEMNVFKKTPLFIVSNASQLFNTPKKLVSYFINLRSLISYDSLIYMPMIANPSTMALLTYLGCDLFDATSAILAARQQHFFLPNDFIHVTNLHENPCHCPVCSQASSHPSTFAFDQLLKHNYFMLRQEIITIRNAINTHHLRDLVEKRIRAKPQLITILRYLDSLKPEYLEMRSPVTMDPSYTLKVTSREASFRPEITRFQNRLKTRYKKPSEKKILLLLPCSAKKPYSFSKSHQRFHQAISHVLNHSVIHEVIVTSPLGLVPRELELTYPAASYDISVTGDWFEDEKQMIQTQLETFLQHNQYDAIVSHLRKDIVHPPKEKTNNWFNTLGNENPTSETALKKLTETLNQLIRQKNYKDISKSEMKRQQVQAIARYQFGRQLASELVTNCVITGKYPYLKILDEHQRQLGMIPDQRGLISLTAEGGKRLCSLQKYTVFIKTGFTVKGSILAPGILSSDSDIRRGDDVIVIQGDSYLGVGVATMNGEEMIRRSYGEAVNMRHKIKTKE